MFDLKNLALGLIVLGMLIGFGLLIMEQTKGMLATQIGCANSATHTGSCMNATNGSAYVAVNTAETAIITITSWLGIIVLVVMAALVMRYLLSAFSGAGGGAA
jgi:hypothetical protein